MFSTYDELCEFADGAYCGDAESDPQAGADPSKLVPAM